MTDINSAESYYLYRADAEKKLAQMTATSNRLNTEIKDIKLQSAIEKQVRDPDVSNLIFNLTKGSATETDNGFNVGDLPLDRAIESIRDNESLQRFFSKADIPVPAPQRVYKLWFE
jgi:hypothetical protein